MVIWKAFTHFHSDRLCKFGWRFPNQWVQLQPEVLGDVCWPCLYRNGPMSSRGPRKLEGNKVAVEQMLKRREAGKRRQWGAKSPVWEKGSGCREVLCFANSPKQVLTAEKLGIIGPRYTGFVGWALPGEKHILESFFLQLPFWVT